MGFWSSLGQAATAAGKSAKDQMEKVNNLIEEYDNESDDYVKHKFKNGSALEKMAANKVLRNRGYTKDSI